MALEEDLMSQTIQVMRMLSRRVRAQWNRLRRLTGPQRTRSLLEEVRDAQRNDPEFDRSLRGMDDRDRTRALEQHARDLPEQISREQARQQELLRDQIEQQRNDRDGDGIDDAVEARDRDAQDNELAHDQDRDGQDDAVERRQDQQAERDRDAESRKEDRRDRENQPDGVDAGTATAAGAAVGTAAVAADELDDRAEEQDQAEQAEQGNEQAEPEQDGEFVNADGSVNQEALAPEVGEQGQDPSPYVNDDLSVDEPAVDGQDAEVQQDVDRDLGQDGEFVNADGSVNQEALAPEVDQPGQDPSPYVNDDLSYDESAVDGQDAGLQHDVDNDLGQDGEFVNADGSVNQEALAPEVGEQGQDPSPYVNDDLSVDEPAVDGQDAGLQHDVDNDLGQDGQFVNADGSVNQEALNGQDADLQQEGLQQGDGGPEPGLPTAGDRQLSNEIAEQNAPNGPQQPVEKVLDEERAKNGGPGSQQSGNNPMTPEEISRNNAVCNDGTAPAALAAQQPGEPALTGGRGGQTAGKLHQQNRGSRGSEGPSLGE